MADIFISYKKEDRGLAERVVALLRAEGRSVWWDDGITPHQAWDDMIEQEIDAARAVIVLWSPRSVASEWVRSEAHYAQEHGKLVPVMIETCNLPIAFALRQAIDLSGDLETDSPGWQKLETWLDGMLGGEHKPPTPKPSMAGKPATPAPAARRMTFGKWQFAAAAAAVVVLVGGFGYYKSSAAAVQPEVVVDPFTIDSSFPKSFASDLNDEMFATFSSSSRITPRTGNGTRVAGAYQVGGRIDTDGDNVRLYLQVFAPGLDAPILTTRMEQPRKSLDSIPREFGFNLAEIARCIATASDSNDAAITTLPLEAAKAWAKFCSMPPGTPANGYLPSLRATVAAAPDFANGWANLSELAATAARNPSVANRAALYKEAQDAADKALAIDPNSAKAYMMKASFALPRFDINAPDRFPRFSDFATWQKLSDKSLSVRPSDCGCETSTHGYALLSFGRVGASLPYMEQEKAQTGAWGADLDRALVLVIAGRSLEAKQLLDGLAKSWPTEDDVRDLRGLAAIVRHDWAEAALMIDAQPLIPAKEPLLAYVHAQAAGNKAGADAAVAKLRPLSTSDSEFPWEGALALAQAGSPQDAVTAVDRLLHKSGAQPMMLLWSPDFAAARQTPEFAALVTRVGLPKYWATKGNRPDFCAAPGAPAMCRGFPG
ncbi:MAG: TIR domain-containing protein [Croceibacterium sp.]